MRKSRSTPALTRTLRANPVEEGGKSLGEQAKEKRKERFEASLRRRHRVPAGRPSRQMRTFLLEPHRGVNQGCENHRRLSRECGLEAVCQLADHSGAQILSGWAEQAFLQILEPYLEL